jgi:hypothetical protein
MCQGSSQRKMKLENKQNTRSCQDSHGSVLLMRKMRPDSGRLVCGHRLAGATFWPWQLWYESHIR